MERHALIGGVGITATACHALLRRFGWSTAGTRTNEAAHALRNHFVVLNQTTWELIGDVFGGHPTGAVRTNQRLLVHHDSQHVYRVAETHFIVPSKAIQRMGKHADRIELADGTPSLETRPEAHQSEWISSGNRVAAFYDARIGAEHAAEAVIFEFVRHGWVFWAPTGCSTGFLHFTLPDPEVTAERCLEIWRSTRLLKNWVIPLNALHTGGIPSAAAARRRAVGKQVVYCGSAAMCFDPISGDGTGACIRSAILACAAIRYAAEHPAQAADALAHYADRMAQAFQSHLNACAELYDGAELSAPWAEEKRAIRAAAELAPGTSRPWFRLSDFSLSRT